MSENATESTESAQTTEADAQQNEETQADTTDWKAEARKWEARAKENSGAAKAAEKARLDAMSESERAIEEAKQSARAEAATEYGKRLVVSEIKAAAATAGVDVGADLDVIDLKRFLDDANEPDGKAIQKWIDSKPKKQEGVAGFDGGARSTSKAPDFNQVLRQAAGRA